MVNLKLANFSNVAIVLNVKLNSLTGDRSFLIFQYNQKEKSILSKLIHFIFRSLATGLIAFYLLFICLNTPALADTDLDNGAKVFKANCAGCHVNGGNIVRRGKNLKLKTLHKRKVDTQEAIATLVTNGKGIMSAYGDKLTQQEIADVSAFVLQRAEQGWKK